MKTMKLTMSTMALAVTMVLTVYCRDNKAETKVETTTEKQGKEYTSAYVCPMHCKGSGSDEEGNCPVCGMNYVLNEKHIKEGHEHN